MTAELDDGVGHILDTLDEHGLADSTYVIYTSDNGGESMSPSPATCPLPGARRTCGKAASASPARPRSGHRRAGSRSDVPAIGYDFFATIAEWVGASEPLPENQDGGSLHGVLTNGGWAKCDAARSRSSGSTAPTAT